jgi:hypothetical protein
LILHQVKIPPVPSADQFRPGLQTGKLDCNGTAAPVEKTVANETLYHFCNLHQGVNIAQGDNYSTFYDTVNDTRLYFNVITRVAECSANCGFEWTAGGQTTMDCIAFDLNAEGNVVPAAPVVGDQGDGVVVTCEGLCEGE